jgi:hypothetical protein
MGDRANIIIREGDEQLFLYGHWSGGHYVAAAQAALAKHWRWDDVAYLTRIVYDEFVKGHEGEETSFGIWVTRPDNEHPYCVIDVAKQRVYFEAEPGSTYTTPNPRAREGWTFAEFVALAEVPDPHEDA